MAARSAHFDVPTGSDALDGASGVGNLFRCGFDATGDDATPVGATDLIEQVVAASATFWGGFYGGPSERLNCRAYGDLIIRLRDDFAEVWRVLLGRTLPSTSLEEERYGLPVATPAAQLRELTRLDAARLGRITGVTRQTYQAWLAGTSPRAENLNTLLRVLSLIQETATDRGTHDVGIWLQTPVEAGEATTPLDLLAEREYAAFRGFAHRVPIEERLMRRPTRNSRSAGISSREWRRRPERIARTAWEEEPTEDS